MTGRYEAASVADSIRFSTSSNFLTELREHYNLLSETIMGNIIGFGGSIHDFATCLIKEDRNILAVEDERLTRIRYAVNSPNPCDPSLRYCLKWSGLDIEDISSFWGNDMLDPASLPAVSSRVTLLNHHLSHAYSTFFTSPFEDAAILVTDGAGSLIYPETASQLRETTSYAWGRGNEIGMIGRVVGDSSGISYSPDFPPVMCNSLGDFYRAITEVIGFGFLHAGKAMGLAPYGDDSFVSQVMNFVTLLPEGQFEIAIGGDDGLMNTLARLRRRCSETAAPFGVDAAIAYAGQAALEEVFLHALRWLWKMMPVPRLCLAGGVALNSVMAGKIPRLTNFKDVHVFFAPGDSGTAVGAAIYGYLDEHTSAGEPIRFHSGPYWGRPIAHGEMRDALERRGIVYTRPSDLSTRIAVALNSGAVVGWYQGRSEFGPRALGDRSILADPRSADIRDRVNRDIKNREWFRPLAPAVMASEARHYFDLLCPSQCMQFVWPVREEFRTLLQGVTHVDGGARVQTINQAQNEPFYGLLEACREVSGVPVLLNTSLNIRGTPIVETPDEAIEAFLRSELDALVLGDFFVAKRRSG